MVTGEVFKTSLVLGLASIKEGLEKTKRQKKYDKIIERIGRLKESYKVGNL